MSSFACTNRRKSSRIYLQRTIRKHQAFKPRDHPADKKDTRIRHTSHVCLVMESAVSLCTPTRRNWNARVSLRRDSVWFVTFYDFQVKISAVIHFSLFWQRLSAEGRQIWGKKSIGPAFDLRNLSYCAQTWGRADAQTLTQVNVYIVHVIHQGIYAQHTHSLLQKVCSKLVQYVNVV